MFRKHINHSRSGHICNLKANLVEINLQCSMLQGLFLPFTFKCQSAKLFSHVNSKYKETVNFFLEWLQMNPECLHGQVLRLQMPHFDAMYLSSLLWKQETKVCICLLTNYLKFCWMFMQCDNYYCPL